MQRIIHFMQPKIVEVFTDLGGIETGANKVFNENKRNGELYAQRKAEEFINNEMRMLREKVKSK